MACNCDSIIVKVVDEGLEYKEHKLSIYIDIDTAKDIIKKQGPGVKPFVVELICNEVRRKVANII